MILIRTEFFQKPQIRHSPGPENHKSTEYPPDIHRMRSDLWPLSVERRFQPMRWTLHLGLHVCLWLEAALDAHWPQIGSHPVDIRWISGGYPPEGFMIFRPRSVNPLSRSAPASTGLFVLFFSKATFVSFLEYFVGLSISDICLFLSSWSPSFTL